MYDNYGGGTGRGGGGELEIIKQETHTVNPFLTSRVPKPQTSHSTITTFAPVGLFSKSDLMSEGVF